MKNQTCIWSEEPSHLKGRISGDREALNTKHDDVDKHWRWLKNSIWMCRNMQHPLHPPPPWQPLWCQWSKMEDWAAQDVRLLTRSGIVQVSIWAESDSLEVFIVRTWMRFLLRASLRNHMCLRRGWGQGGQQLADVLLIEQHNRPDSVNQLYRRNKFRLTAHFL